MSESSSLNLKLAASGGLAYNPRGPRCVLLWLRCTLHKASRRREQALCQFRSSKQHKQPECPTVKCHALSVPLGLFSADFCLCCWLRRPVFADDIAGRPGLALPAHKPRLATRSLDSACHKLRIFLQHAITCSKMCLCAQVNYYVKYLVQDSSVKKRVLREDLTTLRTTSMAGCLSSACFAQVSTFFGPFSPPPC